ADFRRLSSAAAGFRSPGGFRVLSKVIHCFSTALSPSRQPVFHRCRERQDSPGVADTPWVIFFRHRPFPQGFPPVRSRLWLTIVVNESGSVVVWLQATAGARFGCSVAWGLLHGQGLRGIWGGGRGCGGGPSPH